MTPRPSPPIITPAGAALRFQALFEYRYGRARVLPLPYAADDDWTPPGGASAMAVPAAHVIDARAA